LFVLVLKPLFLKELLEASLHLVVKNSPSFSFENPLDVAIFHFFAQLVVLEVLGFERRKLLFYFFQVFRLIKNWRFLLTLTEVAGLFSTSALA
jgi:hypothetical protein